MIAEPPFEAGAVNETVTRPLPATPDTPVGAPGTPAHPGAGAAVWVVEIHSPTRAFTVGIT